MFSKEEAFNKINELVERFSLQIDSYKKSDYNETQTSQDFINPFFKALGWDIDNSQGSFNYIKKNNKPPHPINSTSLLHTYNTPTIK